MILRPLRVWSQNPKHLCPYPQVRAHGTGAWSGRGSRATVSSQVVGGPMALVMGVQRLASLLSSTLTSAQPRIHIKHRLAGERPSTPTANPSRPSIRLSVRPSWRWSPRDRCPSFPPFTVFPKIHLRVFQRKYIYTQNKYTHLLYLYFFLTRVVKNHIITENQRSDVFLSDLYRPSALFPR